MSSSKKNPDAERLGGPGSSQQNREHPEKGEPKKPHPHHGTSAHSSVSGGGGESDLHHERSATGKSGKG